MTDKKHVRSQALKRRREFAQTHPHAKKLYDEAIVHSILSIAQDYDSIGLYYSYRDEIDTHELCRNLASSQRGQVVSLPRVDGDDMQFYILRDEADLEPNHWGILEPRMMDNPCEPQLLIVPLAAFNSQRYRIGYGRGFYDRYISAHGDVKTVGVAYSFMHAEFEPDAWDVPCDAIVTEQGVLLR